jgi:hypothetical protein
LQLARIPLHLQLFLDVFRQTGRLPTSRAQLLSHLIDHLVDREEARGDGKIDRFANEHVLGGLAFRSTAEGYALRVHETYARHLVLQALETLRSSGLVAADVRFGDVWRHLLSANFLKSIARNSVEWLHQLVRDYFLGTEYARIWRRRDDAQVDVLKRRLGQTASDVACTIALTLLDEQNGGLFLLYLVDTYPEHARRAYEGQVSSVRLALVSVLIQRTLAESDHETKTLRKLSRTLPYSEVVDALDTHFYETEDDEMRAPLIEAITELLIEHMPRVAAGEAGFPGFMDSWLRESRFQTTKAAVKRSGEVLRKYLRNKNDVVSFFAAKGLSELDRSAAVERLRTLSFTDNARVAAMVRDLIDDWGIH